MHTSLHFKMWVIRVRVEISLFNKTSNLGLNSLIFSAVSIGYDFDLGHIRNHSGSVLLRPMSFVLRSV